MANELFLIPLIQTAERPAEEIIAEIRAAALAAVPRNDDAWFVEENDGGQLEIETPCGSMTVGPEVVSVRLESIAPEVVRLIHSVAKRARLAILNEGGGPRVLIADAADCGALPPELREEKPTLCATAGELAKALLPQFELPTDRSREAIQQRDLLYSQWTRDHRVRSIGHGDPHPNVPGLIDTREQEPVYIETKSKEGGLLLFRRLSRFVRERAKSGQAMPDGGGLGGTGWQIRLPGGAVMTCVLVAGYHFRDASDENRIRRIAEWLKVVQEFAATTKRRTARIRVDGIVEISDGSRYPMDQCESRRARDEDC